jgi:hypothetical protein
MAFSIHSIYGQVFKIWRRRRFDLFVHSLQPRLSDTMLDVGGYPGVWTTQPQPCGHIVTLNVDKIHWDKESAPHHNITSMSGDGCSLPMPDQSFDILYSNSVIEHVGDWHRQQQFASEARRVGKALWVQTPAYECPIEPHYMTPFIHYFPASFQRKMARWFTVWGLIERPNRKQVELMVGSIRLLRKVEMARLFPDCEIMTERLLWIIPKSYIAIRRRLEPGAESNRKT